MKSAIIGGGAAGLYLAALYPSATIIEKNAECGRKLLLTGGGRCNFTHERWSVSTGLQYVAGLYTAVKTNSTGEETKENFLLWNLQGAFRATKWLEIWVRGENLLAQQYEIIAGYPMPRATFMGGVNINF